MFVVAQQRVEQLALESLGDLKHVGAVDVAIQRLAGGERGKRLAGRRRGALDWRRAGREALEDGVSAPLVVAIARLDQIADDPFGRHTKPLTGPGERRGARVGGLRIVFTVDRAHQLVEVSEIGPRGDIYRRL